MKLALFDLDHTLLPLDSDHTWGVFTTEMGWNDPAVFSQRNDEFYAHYQAGTLDIHDYVRFATRAARERGATAAAQAHARYMDDVIRPRITPEALALVRSHQRAGDTVMITNSKLGFSSKVFEVMEWNFASGGNPPEVFVDMTLRETDSSVYSWNVTDEIYTAGALNTTLPDPFTISAPSAVSGMPSRFWPPQPNICRKRSTSP